MKGEKERLRLVEPRKDLEAAFEDMAKECQDPKEEVSPWTLTLVGQEGPSLVERLRAFPQGQGLPPGFLPMSSFWLLDQEDQLLGAIDIRHGLNDFLHFRGGHIGYGIRPSQRNKGYGQAILALGLREARKLGLEKVLITCYKDNIASAKIIQANGGRLESEDRDQGRLFQRYWIDLK